MNFSRLVFSAGLLCGIAAGAEARQDPTPKPSGVVIHLFGPDSIVSKITPDLPGETAQPVTAQPGGNAVTAADGSAASTPSQPNDSQSPTMGAVLHQMFVVGDPDHPNAPSTGRTADRPPAGN